jgi:hypothetical protein
MLDSAKAGARERERQLALSSTFHEEALLTEPATFSVLPFWAFLRDYNLQK